ncbi:hypothetical protein EVAR_11027_1 [Eumeta japonica]|uniref:Uncharacterized protein n=1 Tax=Eumeta variegata TaxID=151549 RepID=A0A4C1U4E7_EUMVA|nr:hypothetical protein EVAR_11027_1 [Eumeta japonica]
MPHPWGFCKIVAVLGRLCYSIWLFIAHRKDIVSVYVRDLIYVADKQQFLGLGQQAAVIIAPKWFIIASSIRRRLCVCSLNPFTNTEAIVRTLVVASAPILLASFRFRSSAASMVAVTMQSLYCQILERSTLFSHIQCSELEEGVPHVVFQFSTGITTGGLTSPRSAFVGFGLDFW